MSVSIPAHLYRNRHGWFYFRLVLPQELRHLSERREYRFSLDTERRQEAIMRSLPLLAALPALFDSLKQMSDSNDSPLPSNHFEQWIEAERQKNRLRERVEELEAQLTDAKLRLDQSVPRENAERVVKSAYTVGQLKGKQETEERVVFPWPAERTVRFSELLAAYLKSLTYRAQGGRKKPPTPKTLESYEKDIGFFVTVMGDLRIGEIDRTTAGEYFATLCKLPPNLSRVARYRGKTIVEIQAMGDPPQSEDNASKKVERASAMFGWALEEKRKWGIDGNPFKGFGQSDDRPTTRRPFTPDELRAIFKHPDFTDKTFFNSYAYWLVPLGIYTGARLGELCQLDLKDFIEVEGIPCIDINDTDAVEVVTDEGGRKKRVKNSNAKRLVPIHSELIRLGLLRYVDALRAKGGFHLFPELNRRRRDGPGHAASNWFQRFREKVGLTEKQATVFHSFRYLFITTILDRDVSPHMLAPIVGHEAELITGQVYWNKKDATKRQPTVEVFALPQDISAMIPAVDDVRFRPSPGPTRGRRHARQI